AEDRQPRVSFPLAGSPLSLFFPAKAGFRGRIGFRVNRVGRNCRIDQERQVGCRPSAAGPRPESDVSEFLPESRSPIADSRKPRKESRMAKCTRLWWARASGLATLLCWGSVLPALAAPTPAQILSFTPRQAGVDCTTPAPDQQKDCKVELVKTRAGSG